MSRFVFAVMLSLVGTARAQWLDSGSHLLLTGGGATRAYTQSSRTDSSQTFGVNGPSPTNLHLSGTYLFHKVFGVSLEGRGEFIYAVKRVNGAIAEDSPNFFLPAFDAAVSLAARWRISRGFGLEGQLGPQFSLRSGVDWRVVDPQVSMVPTPQAAQRVLLGPTVGLVATISPGRLFAMQAWVRLVPIAGVFSQPGRDDGAILGTLGVQAALGALQLGPLQLGVAATLEGSFTYGVLSNQSVNVQQNALRFGLGVSLLKFVPDAEVATPSGPQPLTGRVESAQGQPVANAKVQLDGRDGTVSDARGQFSFAAVPEGPHRLTAELDGVTPAALEVTVPVREAVVLKLGAPTGPGTVLGVVTSNDTPFAGATVTAVEANVSVKSGADGSYALAKVGPGPVTVKVTASDFKDAEEVAQVQPGGSASVDFKLVPKTAAAQATLRGLVRSKTGEAVKATVRVVELKLKLAVKADGRFTADVPSGKYTLVIEAKGYVTQTKTVEVSGGDQAIFHTELERSR